jgi:hypothetical protein
VQRVGVGQRHIQRQNLQQSSAPRARVSLLRLLSPQRWLTCVLPPTLTTGSGPYTGLFTGSFDTCTTVTVALLRGLSHVDRRSFVSGSW